ncbi:MAG: hypothetical protein LKG38_05360 [Atopobiaceae bacterium]|jgi:hypothetical protein|nr:hypothetical protein [Atopobiaceae bacterium]MCH4120255.1 hypothetical protein [Atopobiaceae bacterium]MCI1318751.1 hypothetical protein [Atopobiaceae bacterium]MCI1388907.1 hypothetical protein [Atopobiaceae bacterium]MCI1431859.1 hypothetical protein [Atopobiaceae bacterium]
MDISSLGDFISSLEDSASQDRQEMVRALDVLRCNLEAGNVLTAGVLGEQLWQSMFVSGLLSGH